MESPVRAWTVPGAGGRVGSDVVDLTSPDLATALFRGALKHEPFSQGFGYDEEEDFSYILSQDSAAPGEIGPTPENIRPNPVFEKIEYTLDGGDSVPIEQPPVEVEPNIRRDTLNEEQREASNMAIYGRKNIFLTGAAGTGKSFLLRYIIQQLKGRRKGDVFVTATTGIAAENIKGTTLHSFAGIGLGEGNVDQLISKIKNSKPATQRWKRVKYLIVDEVSMLHVDLFEKLEEIARRMKRSSKNSTDKPFGGIKLILCGDFFQLPPVDRKRSGNKYAFQSTLWTEDCAIQTVALREVHRQTDDTFVNLLNEVRIGRFTEHTRRQLDACHCSVKPMPNDGILPTKLYCLNKNVDAENLYHLNKLPHPDVVYTGSDNWVPRRDRSRGDDGYGSNNEGFQEEIDPQTKATMMADVDRKAPIAIRLRIGAQVMYVRNDPNLGLVNGSRGVVVALEETMPIVKFDNGSTLPLKFESFVQSCQEGSLVRRYMPLKLAWALTVHKSQGMTLTRVELQLDNAFECGQVYVALSRVKSLPGLFIRGGKITPDLVRADESVLAIFGPTGTNEVRQNTLNEYFSAIPKRKRESVKEELRSTPQPFSDDDTSECEFEEDTAFAGNTTTKRQRDSHKEKQDLRRASSGSSSGGETCISSSSSSRSPSSGDGPHFRAPVDVIDLISPDRIQLAVRRVRATDVAEKDVFQRLVEQSTQSHMSQDEHHDWASAATQVMPSQSQANQLSQPGPFSATYSQLRDQAYGSRPLSSCSSTSALSSTSSSAGAYWRSKDAPYPVGGAYAAFGATNAAPVPLYQPQVAVRAAAPVAVASPPVSVNVSKAILYFDGGALGNPGVGGAGYLLYRDSPQPPHVTATAPFTEAAVRMIGTNCTNNQAEYTGLIHGLQAAVARGVRTITVYGDSELVIKQMKGEYKVKNPVLKGMNQRAQLLAGSFANITYNWVERSKNKPADALSGRAMHQPSSAEECAERIG